MNAVTDVEAAQRMARRIEDYEYTLVGDRDIARDRLARRYGITVRLFRRLRYDPPKQIATDLYNALCNAVEDVARREIKRLEGEIHDARARRVGSGDGSLRAAEAALEQARAHLTDAIRSTDTEA